MNVLEDGVNPARSRSSSGAKDLAGGAYDATPRYTLPRPFRSRKNCVDLSDNAASIGSCPCSKSKI
jgi:hypothetical protein